MNVKFLAASAASDSATVGLAKAGGDLLTPEDYIEYASMAASPPCSTGPRRYG